MIPNTLSELRDFVSAIPDDKWTTGFYHQDGCSCIMGHLGCSADDNVNNIPIIERYLNLFKSENNISLVTINDARDSRFQQPTPKTRILAAIDYELAN